jgi:hypothetical protein
MLLNAFVVRRRKLLKEIRNQIFKSVPLQVLPDNDILLLIDNDNLGLPVFGQQRAVPMRSVLFRF